MQAADGEKWLKTLGLFCLVGEKAGVGRRREACSTSAVKPRYIDLQFAIHMPPPLIIENNYIDVIT